jgi:tetratricopeptide (TPR) repeat protein
MPHLSQLAREYSDKDVTVIGMTSEDPSNTLEKVRAMVEDKGDVMDYTVAWDVEQQTNEAWMKAAGQRGIPACFLVDKAGKVAWIGHPAVADIPLAKVVDGTWDYEEGPALMKAISERRSAIYEAAAKEPAEALRLFDALADDEPLAVKGLEGLRFSALAKLPERADEAAKLGGQLVDEAIAAKNSGSLNEIAWNLVDPEVELENRFLDLAQRAAEQADTLTNGEDAAIIDTLARVHFWRGDFEQALAIQRRAVEHAEGQMKTALEGVVAEYEKAQALSKLGYVR